MSFKLPGLPFPTPWESWEGPVFGEGGRPEKAHVDPHFSARLPALLKDEQDAFNEYEGYAYELIAIGRYDLAAKLEEMAEDEHKHYVFIQEMMAQIKKEES